MILGNDDLFMVQSISNFVHIEIGLSMVFTHQKLVHAGRTLTSLLVQIICDLIQSGGIVGAPYVQQRSQPVELIFCNPDLLWRSDFPRPRLGQGAFKEAFQAVYKVARIVSNLIYHPHEDRRLLARPIPTFNTENPRQLHTSSQHKFWTVVWLIKAITSHCRLRCK